MLIFKVRRPFRAEETSVLGLRGHAQRGLRSVGLHTGFAAIRELVVSLVLADIHSFGL